MGINQLTGKSLYNRSWYACKYNLFLERKRENEKRVISLTTAMVMMLSLIGTSVYAQISPIEDFETAAIGDYVLNTEIAISGNKGVIDKILTKRIDTTVVNGGIGGKLASDKYLKLKRHSTSAGSTFTDNITLYTVAPETDVSALDVNLAFSILMPEGTSVYQIPLTAGEALKAGKYLNITADKTKETTKTMLQTRQFYLEPNVWHHITVRLTRNSNNTYVTIDGGNSVRLGCNITYPYSTGKLGDMPINFPDKQVVDGELTAAAAAQALYFDNIAVWYGTDAGDFNVTTGTLQSANEAVVKVDNDEKVVACLGEITASKLNDALSASTGSQYTIVTDGSDITKVALWDDGAVVPVYYSVVKDTKVHSFYDFAGASITPVTNNTGKAEVQTLTLENGNTADMNFTGVRMEGSIVNTAIGGRASGNDYLKAVRKNSATSATNDFMALNFISGTAPTSAEEPIVFEAEFLTTDTFDSTVWVRIAMNETGTNDLTNTGDFYFTTSEDNASLAGRKFLVAPNTWNKFKVALYPGTTRFDVTVNDITRTYTANTTLGTKLGGLRIIPSFKDTDSNVYEMFCLDNIKIYYGLDGDNVDEDPNYNVYTITDATLQSKDTDKAIVSNVANDRVIYINGAASDSIINENLEIIGGSNTVKQILYAADGTTPIALILKEDGKTLTKNYNILFRQTKLSFTKDDDTNSFIYSYQYFDPKYKFIVAKYSHNGGVLENVEFVSVPSGYKSNIAQTTKPVALEDGYLYKAFVWDFSSDIIPISQFLTIK